MALMVLSGLLFVACNGAAEQAGKSMEQIYAEEGRPVEARMIRSASFSVFLNIRRNSGPLTNRAFMRRQTTW